MKKVRRREARQGDTLTAKRKRHSAQFRFRVAAVMKGGQRLGQPAMDPGDTRDRPAKTSGNGSMKKLKHLAVQMPARSNSKQCKG